MSFANEVGLFQQGIKTKAKARERERRQREKERVNDKYI